MVRIELAPEEAEALHFILDSYLSDLRSEIRETDSRTFRANLKQREEFVKKLMQQLEGAGAAAQKVSPG
jgi:hypothetical protein